MDYDWIIIGSGFGGSVSALRLVEKGYKVLVIEKGKRFGRDDFPKTNWDLKRWMWMPRMGLEGIFQMSFLDHVTVLHGVGVGGGSLTYANTLPKPNSDFFEAKSWSHLGDWERELGPHYKTAQRMLGAAPNPRMTPGDHILKEIAKDIDREEHFHMTDVAVYFGAPGETAEDPYFDGAGPSRVGCTYCGACMTGCRVGAKNTLDQNYLYLAERRGLTIKAETEVTHVREAPGGGYRVTTIRSLGRRRKKTESVLSAKRVIFAGGVMGTIPLLLKLKADPSGLPRLSSRVGDMVRTNSESLTGIVAPKSDTDYTEGIAITSILHTDENSHLEPVRYGRGSGFFRLLMAPHPPGKNVAGRLASLGKRLLRTPGKWAGVAAVRDFAKHSQVLLYMRTLEGTLQLRLKRTPLNGFTKGLASVLAKGQPAPAAFMEEATELADRFADKTDGVVSSLVTEALLGTPSTAHILGGACMGESAASGVINADHQVYGYDGLYVIDGAAVSANPGVNPSLTITALAERAMSKIPAAAAS